MSFALLHNYSEYSLPDGSMTTRAIAEKAQRLGMSSVALTDRGTLAGAGEFRNSCRAVGVKPIFGLEVDTRISLRSGVDHTIALVLLAMDEEGWGNLCRISSRVMSSEQAMPVGELENVSAGLVCMVSGESGALGGIIRAGRDDTAIEVLQQVKDIWAADDLFVAIPPADASPIRESLLDLCRKSGVPPVAASRALYADKEDAEAYRIIRAIRSSQDDLAEATICEGAYLRSASEMSSGESDCDDAVTNAAAIAERCNVKLPRTTDHPPVELADGCETAIQYLRQLATDGLKARVPDATPTYDARLEHEMSVIEAGGHAEYFLFVRSYVAEAKRLGFWTSDRGSASGCLVNYALGITTIDPIAFDLVFERFLNPCRPHVSPDIDIDVESRGRTKVMDSLASKWGENHVASVGRFTRFSERSATEATGAMLGYSRGEVQGLLYECDIDPDWQGDDERDRLLLKTSRLLAGLVQRTGTHPCGLVVTSRGLDGRIPTRCAPDARHAATQCDMRSIEALGGTKYDLIGSTYLEILHATVDLVATQKDERVDLEAVPLDDPKTLALFRAGRTTGVFYFGSQPIRDFLLELKIDTFEDVVAALAVFRPGPKDQAERFLQRKRDGAPAETVHPLLSGVLDKTYGLIVYQEQILEIASKIGGLSGAEADVMRRELRKPDSTEVETYRAQFVAGAQKREMAAATADALFTDIVAAGASVFNRSHATSYARVCFHGAFLKAHHPIEYVTAFINKSIGNRRAVDEMIAEARELGLPVSPPDINGVGADSAIRDGRICLGLATVSRLGAPAMTAILAEREKNGPFKDIFDLSSRVDEEILTRRALLSLIASGALGSLPGRAAQQFASVDSRGDSRGDLPAQIDSFDLLREIAAEHGHVARDLSFDIYCPRSYAHHFRFTMWLPATSVIYNVDISKLIEQARLFAGYFESDRRIDYAIGLNSRVSQYAEKHLLMLDLDSVDEAAIELLTEFGGHLMKSGRGYHFIGSDLILDAETWRSTLQDIRTRSELVGHLDQSHIEMSLKRGYSTLRILESPAKPRRPMLIRTLRRQL
jgi:DNA polymerase-3 subunit alpha